jgi:ABC-type uncharacterized transport system fused permease/ATPase subunit
MAASFRRVWSMDGLLAASVGLQLALVFTRMTMQRRWRAWLNDHLVDRTLMLEKKEPERARASASS